MIAGGADMIMNVALDQATQMKAVPHLRGAHVARDHRAIVFLHMDTRDTTTAPPLRERKVRQAISHAIDRDAMVKQIVGEGARVLHTVSLPLAVRLQRRGRAAQAYDPAKAKALLAEAGFPNGFEVDIYAYRERNSDRGDDRLPAGRRHQGEPPLHAVRCDARGNRAGKAPLLHRTWPVR